MNGANAGINPILLKCCGGLYYLAIFCLHNEAFTAMQYTRLTPIVLLLHYGPLVNPSTRCFYSDQLNIKII